MSSLVLMDSYNHNQACVGREPVWIISYVRYTFLMEEGQSVCHSALRACSCARHGSRAAHVIVSVERWPRTAWEAVWRLWGPAGCSLSAGPTVEPQRPRPCLANLLVISQRSYNAPTMLLQLHVIEPLSCKALLCHYPWPPLLPFCIYSTAPPLIIYFLVECWNVESLTFSSTQLAYLCNASAVWEQVFSLSFRTVY